MKKALLLFLLAASPSFAALVTCTPRGDGKITVGGVLAVQDYVCAPSALAGNLVGDGLLVTGIEVVVTANGSNPPDDVVTFGVTVTPTNIAGLNSPPAFVLSCLADFDGCTAGPLSSSAATAVGPVDEFAAFTIRITPSAQQPGNPLVLNSATATVEYRAITATAVPEPGSALLLGSALVGIAVLRRRR